MREQQDHGVATGAGAWSPPVPDPAAVHIPDLVKRDSPPRAR